MELDYPRMSTGGQKGEGASDAVAIYPSLSVKPPKSFDDFSRRRMAKMGKAIRALPCHFRPFETGRSRYGVNE